MSYTYDPTTNIGRIRRTLPDKTEDDAFWTDEELQSFLDDEDNNWRRATALALETMATDDLLVLKVIRIQNLETNLDRAMTALLKRAATLREQASIAESTDSDAFEFVDMINNEWQLEERVLKQAARGVL